MISLYYLQVKWPISFNLQVVISHHAFNLSEILNVFIVVILVRVVMVAFFLLSQKRKIHIIIFWGSTLNLKFCLERGTGFPNSELFLRVAQPIRLLNTMSTSVEVSGAVQAHRKEWLSILFNWSVCEGCLRIRQRIFCGLHEVCVQ